MMLVFPKKTEFDKDITAHLFARVKPPALKDILQKQIEHVFWKNKIASSTIHSLKKGKIIEEIQILEIKVRTRAFGETLAKSIINMIPYAVILVCAYKTEIQIYVADLSFCKKKEQHYKVEQLYKTEWMYEEDINLSICGNDTDEVYNNFIRQIKEVTSAQEAHIIRKIMCKFPQMKSLVSIAHHSPRLSPATIKQMYQTIPLSAEQIEILFNSHLRIALKLLLRFLPKDLPEDSISVACECLLKAIRNYNPQENGYFSSYVERYIGSGLSRFNSKQTLIYIPTDEMQLYKKINFYREKCRQIYGKYPTILELSEKTRCSCEKLKQLLSFENYDWISIDTMIEPYNARLGDFILDKQDVSSEDIIKKKYLQEAVQKVLGTLPDREVAIMKSLYGLDDSHTKRTYQEVGKMFNVSKQRISQIEKKIIRKLKHPRCTKILKDYQ